MTCYKDTTFCKFWKKCADGKDCKRALTSLISESAREYQQPICQFIDEPSCYVEELHAPV